MDDNSKKNNPEAPSPTPTEPSQPTPAEPSQSTPAEASQPKVDLSHFKPATAAGDETPVRKEVKQQVMSSLSSSLGNTLDGAKKTASVIQGTTNFVFSNTKRLVMSVIALFLLVVLAIIGINVPTQISRSEAFSAYERGDFQLAADKFDYYLKDRPGDSEAMFYGALTAMKLGDFNRAVKSLDLIANVPGISETPEFLFAHGLSLAPRPDAVTPLNRLIQIEPSHVGGRLLRGVMLARQNEMQRARADFLEADSTIRRGQYDNDMIGQVHNRIAQNAREMLPEYDAKPVIDSDAEIMHHLSQRVGAPVFADAYINRYLPMLPNLSEINASIGDDGLVGMYYTIMLLNVGQFKEARVEFSKLSTETMTASAAGVLQGIMHALTDEYEQAEVSFQMMAERLGKNPVLLFNQANALFMAKPTVEGAQEAVALLDEALKMNEKFSEARHNRAFLRLLLGDVEGAETDMSTVEAEFSQAKILKLLAAISKNPGDPSVNKILQSFGEKERASPNWKYAGIVYNFSRGEHNQALAALRRIVSGEKEWTASTALYADYLSAAGLLMRARHLWLTRAPQESPETFYHVGRLAVQLNNVAEASKILTLMERNSDPDSPHAHALRAIIAYHSEDNPSAAVHIKAALDKAEPEVGQQIVVDSAEMMFDVAPADLRKALLSPVSPNAAANAVIARLKADANDSEAPNIAQDALARRPYYQVQYHAGIALVEAGKTKEGIRTLQDAARWYPNNVALLERIRNLQRQNDQGVEAADTESIIENLKWLAENGDSPENQESLIIDVPVAEGLGETITKVQQQSAHPQDAIKIYNSLINEAGNEEKKILLVQRASFLLSVGDYKGCETDVTQAIGDGLPQERWRQAMLYLGRAQSEQKQFQKAMETYERLITDYPQVPLYRRLAGRAMTNISPNNGITYLSEVVRLFPADIESHFELINAYGKLQNVDGAVSILQQAARISPTYLPIYGTLSRVQRFGDAATAQENSIIADYLRKDS